MSEEVDINKITADFLIANLDRILESASSAMKSTKGTIKSKFKRTYRNYLQRILERHSKAKSFFVRSEAVPIYNFFVPPDLSNEKRTLKAPGIADITSTTPHSIVSGTGGSGKTMLLRHLLVDCIKEQQRTPVLIELRHLNNSDQDIRAALLDTLVSNGLIVDDDYLELALTGGHFCILLDGYDELEAELRESIAKEIQDLSKKYPENWIVLSSRPDEKTQGWTTFAQLTIDPFDLERSIELVEKLPFDGQVKGKFIEALRADLYDKHKSFLSNPLLLSIMLLTYNDNAHIPGKLSIFYSQAYESLFQKHDALKGGFQRKRHTTLDIQDFEKVFSAFCLQSFYKRDFSFSNTEALDYFAQAKKISNVEYDSSAVLKDSIQSVCLLIEDGLEITFAHRSFQEYFAAKFISTAQPDIKGQLVPQLAKEMWADSALELLYEMDPYSVEQHYILPAIDELREAMQLKRKIGITHYIRYLKYAFKNFSRSEDFRGEEQGKVISAEVDNQHLLEALHFIDSNFKNDSNPSTLIGRTAWKEVDTEFVKLYGDSGSVECKSFRSTNPFVRSLMECRGSWSAKYLNGIFEIGKAIRLRHDNTQTSIESIFDL